MTARETPEEAMHPIGAITPRCSEEGDFVEVWWQVNEPDTPRAWPIVGLRGADHDPIPAHETEFWLSPSEARRLAAMLVKAATRAEQAMLP